MTAMERTEELVHNLFVAQNELIAHLANLKAVPNLAAVLFGTPEKNSTPEKNNPIEKNSTPEKNSSEVEEIRQEWMDDVVGLASEFFINEESFNVKNLSDLMINTACALDALLNLKSSVNHEKKFTLLDKLREDEPRFKNFTDEEIWKRFCPGELDLDYEDGCPGEVNKSITCKDCWFREYSDTDSVNQTEKKITKPTFHQWQIQQLSIEKPLTCREKAKQDYPDAVGENFCGGVYLCPHDYGYTKTRYCSFGCNKYTIREEVCTACWDQPVQSKSV